VRRRVSPRRAVAGLMALALTASVSACAAGPSEQTLAAEALNRGLQAHAAGRYDEAAADYREVLAHDPGNTYAYYNLGQIDQLAGRNESAEREYRMALDGNPDFAPALFNLAILRTQAGARDEAVELYRHVIRVKPNEAGAHLNLGLLLRAAGRTQEGDAEIQQALQLDPSLASPPPATPSSSAGAQNAGSGQ